MHPILFFIFLFLNTTNTIYAQNNICYTVKLDSHEILCLSKGIGSITAQKRALLLQEKIKEFADDYTQDVNSISINELNGSYSLFVDTNQLIYIGPDDVSSDIKMNIKDFAHHTAAQLKTAVQTYRDQHSNENIFKGITYTFIATIFIFLLIKITSLLFSKLKSKLISLTDNYVHLFKIKNFVLLNPERIKSLVSFSIKITYYICILAALYFYVPLVLSFFPWTKKWAPLILNYVIDPFKKIGSVVLNYIPNIFYIIAILILTHFVVRFTKIFFNEVENGNIPLSQFSQEWAQPTFKLVKFLIYALSLVMIFPYLPGSSSPAFQGISVFVGVLVSFGSGSSIANIIAGIVITYMRPFKVGDRVKIADTQGDIIEKNFLVTRIKTIKNIDITIPNSLVLGNHISNFSSSAQTDGLILNLTISIGYDTNWRLVHQLLIEAANRTQLLDTAKKPFVLQTALNDFYVAYELNVYTKHANKVSVIYSELYQNIQDIFNENKIEIMSPHYTAIRDGNAITIPK
ncbi:MAG: mechanosensitive ion channel family protein [Pseudobdellovibrio sp.]